MMNNRPSVCERLSPSSLDGPLTGIHGKSMGRVPFAIIHTGSLMVLMSSAELSSA